MDEDNAGRLLSVRQAAERLEHPSKATYAWIEDGRIPHIARGRRRMLDAPPSDKLIPTDIMATPTPAGGGR